MTTCTGANEMNVIFAPRAVVNQRVVENHSSRSIIEQYIRKAIEDGDNMGSTNRPVPEGGVQRRALIIAPEYEDYPDEQLLTLSATATDVQLVHQLLAIATRRDVSDKDQPRDVILDNRLNLCLAELPPDCTITCTLDCCASGRMLNLPVKVSGHGFRGAPASPAQSTNATPSPSPDVPEDSDYPFTEADQPISRGRADRTTASASNTQNNDGIRPSEPGGASATFKPFNLFSLDGPTAQVLQENLPEREKQLNHIRARILSWSASHQRQEAWNSNNGYAGLFTWAFTQTCLKLKNNQTSPGFFTYQELYDEVSQFVEAQRQGSWPSRPQFVQLWSYLKDDEQATKDCLMKSRVVL
ncbi:hypothetical protein RSOLAG22IIIB_12633 [Rhizoctonia solani]|uniref:Uncharacterized protein n=1 Tax=Rhizoctonia solani TaxID=456999 RepID=A0A0K6GFL5_9AGAM|nr:hypothetical protein RSOLAG22IIIB_12633 [Rhizoctonia solani]